MKVVQIGSNRGDDSLSRFLKANYTDLEFGLFVEPFSIHIENLTKCYSAYNNVHIENIAIKSPFYKEDLLKLYYVDEDAHGNSEGTYQVTSCKPEHVTKHYSKPKEMKHFMSPCITLADLFSKYNIVELDWLLLDVEGIDADIVMSFNWDNYNIKKVEIEHLHLGPHKDAVKSIFSQRGYTMAKSLSSFDWAFERK